MPGVDFTWKITGHLLLDGAMIDERDAAGWNGREITVTATSYESPFQGSCDGVARTRRLRALSDVVIELGAPHSIISDYELSEQVTEYKLTCGDRTRPPLAMWVAGFRAMTCYNNVCFFMRR
ncbi:MAG: hypothetical protein NT062_19395 [Proteobacteria bacterium]|nr:hypothetical protein [Pseudomonadota bacterium]